MLIVDPDGEYVRLTEALGGEVTQDLSSAPTLEEEGGTQHAKHVWSLTRLRMIRPESSAPQAGVGRVREPPPRPSSRDTDQRLAEAQSSSWNRSAVPFLPSVTI